MSFERIKVQISGNCSQKPVAVCITDGASEARAAPGALIVSVQKLFTGFNDRF